jgi:16S rRNA (guanine527-N7)-methyltransferase
LDRYLALLEKWNEKINLVGTRDADEIRERHLADALAVIPHLPVDARRVVDVGSGAGLPGAVIAIARPDITVLALEPIHKKHAFLAAIRRELPLPNFEPRAIRVEDLEERDFDVAVSRATFALDEWLRIGTTLVRPGGLVLGMEGSEKVELPPGATRHTYQLGSRTRSILRLPITSGR